MCLMMLQDWDYEAYMSNTGKVSGKGMNLKQKTARWNKAEADFVNSCIDAMQNGDLEQEAMFDLHLEKFLVPSKKAQHRVPPTFSKVTQRCNPRKRKLAKPVMMTVILIIMICQSCQKYPLTEKTTKNQITLFLNT